MSARDAEGIVNVIATAVAKGDLGSFAGDRYKYAACNLSSLYKFGTVEVRTMKGASSAKQVNNWVDILNDLYVYACEKIESPVKLVERLSLLGAEGLMRDVFSPANVRELMGYFPKIANLHYSLMEGARLIQVFAYQFDEAFTAKVEKEKPVDAGAFPKFRDHRAVRIYRPDGAAWVCYGRNRAVGVWVDGEEVEDCPAIKWSTALRRFVCTLHDGRRIACNWRRGPEGQDEGPPARAERVGAELFEQEFDFDEDEDDFDEGDDF